MEITIKLQDGLKLDVAKELGFIDLTFVIGVKKDQLKSLEDEQDVKSLSEEIAMLESQNDPVVFIASELQRRVDAATVNAITNQEREKLEGATKQAVEARLSQLK